MSPKGLLVYNYPWCVTVWREILSANLVKVNWSLKCYCKVIGSQSKLKGNLSTFVVSGVPTDGVAPLGATTYAGAN